MKISYNREDNVAMIELSSKKIDHAQEAGDVIIHFSKTDEPVLLEIMDASRFLANLMQVSMRAKSDQPVSVK
ncbi:MAG: DUF2283 domain-containing protein [Candidatus Margulisbacteria bacterium]|nr:DUF2283 domain-containing protein [Candidatus Margulisiibacteriota bacterium]